MARTQLAWLKQPSRNLTAAFQAIIYKDLDNQLIDFVYDSSMPEYYGTNSNQSNASGQQSCLTTPFNRNLDGGTDQDRSQSSRKPTPSRNDGRIGKRAENKEELSRQLIRSDSDEDGGQ